MVFRVPKCEGPGHPAPGPHVSRLFRLVRPSGRRACRSLAERLRVREGLLEGYGVGGDVGVLYAVAGGGQSRVGRFDLLLDRGEFAGFQVGQLLLGGIGRESGVSGCSRRGSRRWACWSHRAWLPAEAVLSLDSSQASHCAKSANWAMDLGRRGRGRWMSTRLSR